MCQIRSARRVLDHNRKKRNVMTLDRDMRNAGWNKTNSRIPACIPHTHFRSQSVLGSRIHRVTDTEGVRLVMGLSVGYVGIGTMFR